MTTLSNDSAVLPRAKTVLILAPHEAERTAIRATLSKSGFATIAAWTQIDAAALCADSTIDIAIVDDSDEGRAVINLLRARNGAVKVLVLSQDDHHAPPDQVLAAALRANADRALSRPLTLSYLVHVVHEMAAPFKPSVPLRAPQQQQMSFAA
ncbi:MAG: response regulator transcription factor [Alphaproteobacteria bacterium]|nr:response regulator transcription factor [Alphaproteobacteria bacterium]